MEAEAPTLVSVIIPARNEAALIGRTLAAVLASAGRLLAMGPAGGVEILVVDNDSVDGTPMLVQPFVARHGVRLLASNATTAAAVRNTGARAARGQILVFIDADTLIPPEMLPGIVAHCRQAGCEAGITRLASLEGGRRAWLWWTFWEHVRRLPLPRAKAMPALMFCTRAVFEQFGPFDERVRIGEEWPILAGLYQVRPHRLIYDRSLTAYTSSRRMELQPWGYTRTFLKYLWAIMHQSGRIEYSDRLRHGADTSPEEPAC